MRVLVVCTGNTCRSPMAAAILADRQPSYEVKSAGTNAFFGQPLSANAQQILAKHGLPHSHSAKQVAPPLLEWAEAVYTMTADQTARLRKLYPAFAERIAPLDSTVDIVDPYGQSLSAYENCFFELKRAISERFD